MIIMSGFEVAGVVFGVLPILIEAVKAYSSVCDSFNTFRHYSREVKKIQVQFRVHRGIFMNECRLLLRLVEGERGASTMLENLDSDKRWTSKDVNDRLNEALKDNFDLYRCIIEASKEILDGMQEDMANFDVIVQKKAQVRALASSPPYLFAHLSSRTSPSRLLSDVFVMLCASLSISQNMRRILPLCVIATRNLPNYALTLAPFNSTRRLQRPTSRAATRCLRVSTPFAPHPTNFMKPYQVHGAVGI